MADEDPRYRTQPEGPDDDEFAVRLGWGESGKVDELGGSLHVVDEWGQPWVDAAPDEPASGPDDRAPGRAPEIGERLEMHHIRTLVVELRNDVSALRRAVRAPAELMELALSIAELRAEVAELLDTKPLDELRADIAALRAEVNELPQRATPSIPLSVLEPMLHEIGGLRSDLVAMKHRTALRATQSAERTADEADQIAHRVAELLSASAPKRSRRS
jgi:hypothetical protein